MTTPRLKTLKPTLATTQRGWKPDTLRGNRHQRGYGYEWEKTRERILHRDNGLCQPHLQQGIPAIGTQVDHIVPKALGGTDEDSNLQTICIECHREKTSREGGRG